MISNLTLCPFLYHSNWAHLSRLRILCVTLWSMSFRLKTNSSHGLPRPCRWCILDPQSRPLSLAHRTLRSPHPNLPTPGMFAYSTPVHIPLLQLSQPIFLDHSCEWQLWDRPLPQEAYAFFSDLQTPFQSGQAYSDLCSLGPEDSLEHRMTICWIDVRFMVTH